MFMLAGHDRGGLVFASEARSQTLNRGRQSLAIHEIAEHDSGVAGNRDYAAQRRRDPVGGEERDVVGATGWRAEEVRERAAEAAARFDPRADLRISDRAPLPHFAQRR